MSDVLRGPPFWETAADTLAGLFGDGDMAAPPDPPGGPQPLLRLLPWRAWDPATELYLNAASHGFVTEVSPMVGGGGRVVDILSGALADGLPEGCLVQAIAWSSPHVGPPLDAWARPRLRRGGVYGTLASKRTAFLQRAGWKSLFGKTPYLTAHRRVVVACALPGEATPDTEARLTFFRRTLENALESLGSTVRRLEPDAFLSFVAEIVKPSMAAHPPAVRWNGLDPLHEHLAAPDHHIAVSRRKLVLGEAVEAHVQTAVGWPRYWVQHNNAALLGDFARDTMRPLCPTLTCYLFAPGDTRRERGRAERKLIDAGRKEGNRLSQIFESIAHQQDEWRRVKDLLGKGQKLIRACYFAVAYAPVAHVDGDAAAQALRSVYRARGWRLEQEGMVQLQSWLNCLPFVPAEGGFHDLKRFGRLRSQLTWNAASLMPLQGEWPGRIAKANPPGMLLFGRRGQPACWNPFDNDAGNYNVAVVGESGSGKSVFMQELAAALVGGGGRAVVVDDGRSFENGCLLQGGAHVAFGGGTVVCLNPFDMVDAARMARDRDYRHDALELIAGVIKKMARPRTAMDEMESAVIDKHAQRAWEAKGNRATVTDVRDGVAADPEDRATGLHKLLVNYCAGGRAADWFEGPCGLSLDADLTVFELAELKGRPDLQGVVLMVLFFLATERVYKGDRSRPTALVCDEAWDLMTGGGAATFLEGVARRARKYKGTLVTGTQSMNDYFSNPSAMAAWENSSWRVFLSQAADSIDLLAEDKKVDAGMVAALKTLRTASGRYSELLLSGGGGWSVLRLILDPWSAALYSSKGEDAAAIRRLLAEGRTLAQAIDAVASATGGAES